MYKWDDETMLLFTVDFFPPVVDDPFDYGSIAAANSLSDIYAMGGSPLLALNLFSCPANMPPEIRADILRGGMSKVREAGAMIGGGHSMQDSEPKYGLAVLGKVPTDSLVFNHTAMPGDHLFLSKPLGIGIITTALKAGRAEVGDVVNASLWMKQLNRNAIRAGLKTGITACTDVTGFGLIGHLFEMLKPRGLGANIRFMDLPYLSGVKKLAGQYCFPGGSMANHSFYQPKIKLSDQMEEWEELLIMSPETSGGLILAIPENRAKDVRHVAADTGVPLWRIGVVDDTGILEVRRS